ncbi:oligoribonuclease, mitochondrial isoform X2 [Xiphophorus maculatus]|uniref:oligoribonuclease, mitochondrial isoform X2 n=1 Tax=Xiphophorus maculatus TaxID=8083 RepID=UPI000C6DE812|nr:oligoribonuclease, mitochondrial isoform X2 [Xiphophorus maculatus]
MKNASAATLCRDRGWQQYSSGALSVCLNRKEEELSSMTTLSQNIAWTLARFKLGCGKKPFLSSFFSRHCCSHRSKGSQQRAGAVLKAFVYPEALSRFSSLGCVSAVQLDRMCSKSMSHRMVWVDLEGPSMIINQPDELLDGMSDWCKEHHGKSGLIQAVQNSKMTLEQAEYEFLSFVRQHTPPGQCPLAGNSVHADKRFLDKYMPQFMYHLHYRIIDVSTIKELCRRWFPEAFKMAPHKSATHRALDDIKESIKELQYYRASIFKAPSEEKKHKIIGNSGNKRS